MSNIVSLKDFIEKKRQNTGGDYRKISHSCLETGRKNI